MTSSHNSRLDLKEPLGLDTDRDHRRDRLVETTQQLLSFDTSNPPGETRAAAEWIADYVSSFDVEAEWVVDDAAKPNLVITVPGSTDRTLLYQGHLDTVPFEREEWSVDPLGERHENRVYGRGATDMKGAVAAMLETLRTVATAESDPPVTLQFAFVSDEETGGDAGIDVLLEADAIQADAAVVGETTAVGDHASVTVADKGRIWLTVEATGQAAHGSRPMNGTNAIDRLYSALEECRRSIESQRLNYDAPVDRIVEESRAYYADCPCGAGEHADRLFEYPTVNLGQLRGGNTVNSVPGTATAKLDVRVTPGASTEAVLADLRECIETRETVTVTNVSWAEGTYVEPTAPVVEAVTDAAVGVLPDRPLRRCATGGGDAKKLRRAGVPAVESAVGSDTAHGVDEYVSIESLVSTMAWYLRTPAQFATRRSHG
ncbi:M20 family metallopeptidase [Halobiforma nitratireducens]|uniref:Peptidase M20 n=1 Tax=Halobiforma nitratireducens JCM 10879 TaxID=1227454 RepID=M0M6J2_9EURY|nr:M20 family metallopeptidase [Halobiforma nitratireducens]EMA40239.1 peptidase M20 [Halobiforma nitratireducens JCM 10879]